MHNSAGKTMEYMKTKKSTKQKQNSAQQCRQNTEVYDKSQDHKTETQQCTTVQAKHWRRWAEHWCGRLSLTTVGSSPQQIRSPNDDDGDQGDDDGGGNGGN